MLHGPRQHLRVSVEGKMLSFMMLLTWTDSPSYIIALRDLRYVLKIFGRLPNKFPKYSRNICLGL